MVALDELNGGPLRLTNHSYLIIAEFCLPNISTVLKIVLDLFVSVIVELNEFDVETT